MRGQTGADKCLASEAACPYVLPQFKNNCTGCVSYDPDSLHDQISTPALARTNAEIRSTAAGTATARAFQLGAVCFRRRRSRRDRFRSTTTTARAAPRRATGSSAGGRTRAGTRSTAAAAPRRTASRTPRCAWASRPCHRTACRVKFHSCTATARPAPITRTITARSHRRVGRTTRAAPARGRAAPILSSAPRFRFQRTTATAPSASTTAGTTASTKARATMPTAPKTATARPTHPKTATTVRPGIAGAKCFGARDSVSG